MLRKVIIVSTVVCIVAFVAGSLSMAQPQGRGGQRPGGQPGGRFDPARMREMMARRLQEQFGADDQTWKVMEPRVMKVIELNRQASGGGGRGMFFMGGLRGQRGQRGGDQGGPGGRPRPQGLPDRVPTAVEKAAEQLRTTLESQSASSEAIKKDLTGLRAAR
jgi:hypothetical protein